jgi:glycosyltransferase involved in cell wall biosynthesis
VIIAITVTLFFIILRFTVTVFNYVSNPKLTRVNRVYNDLVSILIPARNEEENIISLLGSIYGQGNYENFEVIVYDDESSDLTYTVCTDFAASHSGCSVIKGDQPPNGWLGKNYACYQLARQAKGHYFLFLDADVRTGENLINSAVHRMHLYKLGLLSLLPNQGMNNPASISTVPLLHYILLNLLPLRLIYLVKSPVISAAFGQFMLFDATIYRQNQWHEQVKDKLAADTEIMRLVKAAKFNGELLLPNNMFWRRRYETYRDAIDSFSRNLLVVFNYSIPALLIYILLLIGGPMLVIMTLNINLIFFMVSLIVLTRVMISLSAGQNVWCNIMLHPIQMVNLAIIAFLSIQKHLTKSNVWKGRKV